MTYDAPLTNAPARCCGSPTSTPASSHRLLDLAAAMKEDPNGWHDALAGTSVACYFAKPSTRTRISFEAAVHRLGGLPIMLRPDELQLGRGEPIADTARVLSSYCDGDRHPHVRAARRRGARGAPRASRSSTR